MFGRVVRLAFGTGSNQTFKYTMIPAGVYGGCLGLLGLYYLDFQPILRYVPIYNRKFAVEEEEDTDK